MTVKEFVDKYNECKEDNDFEELFKKIVTSKYVPIKVKQLIMQVTVNKSVNYDGDVSYIDMFLSKINLALAIYTLYTNIELSHENPYDDYDMLQQNDLINVLCGYIGETEINELFSVHKAFTDNWHELNKSTDAIVLKTIDIIIDKFNSYSKDIAKNIDLITNSEEMTNNK